MDPCRPCSFCLFMSLCCVEYECTNCLFFPYILSHWVSHVMYKCLLHAIVDCFPLYLVLDPPLPSLPLQTTLLYLAGNHPCCYYRGVLFPECQQIGRPWDSTWTSKTVVFQPLRRASPTSQTPAAQRCSPCGWAERPTLVAFP